MAKTANARYMFFTGSPSHCCLSFNSRFRTVFLGERISFECLLTLVLYLQLSFDCRDYLFPADRVLRVR